MSATPIDDGHHAVPSRLLISISTLSHLQSQAILTSLPSPASELLPSSPYNIPAPLSRKSMYLRITTRVKTPILPALYMSSISTHGVQTQSFSYTAVKRPICVKWPGAFSPTGVLSPFLREKLCRRRLSHQGDRLASCLATHGHHLVICHLFFLKCFCLLFSPCFKREDG